MIIIFDHFFAVLSDFKQYFDQNFLLRSTLIELTLSLIKKMLTNILFLVIFLFIFSPFYYRFASFSVKIFY